MRYDYHYIRYHITDKFHFCNNLDYKKNWRDVLTHVLHRPVDLAALANGCETGKWQWMIFGIRFTPHAPSFADDLPPLFIPTMHPS